MSIDADDNRWSDAGTEVLSPQAAQRKGEMLGQLTRHMARRVRRRRIVRGTIAAGVVVVAAGAAWWGGLANAPRPATDADAGSIAQQPVPAPVDDSDGPARTPDESANPSTAIATREVLPVIERVSNGPRPADVGPGVAAAQVTRVGNVHAASLRLNDAELMQAIRTAGIRDGLIRVEGRWALARDYVAQVGGDADKASPQGRGGPARPGAALEVACAAGA
ncbi:MAG: hypothetical protein L6Q35_06775 [Phycisphaerales bacterium]|nr:hypothetical protein [Phycisphaerales bacterium]